ncbi:reprolysin-like metallopeptidase [Ignavibacterium album]|uniref:zinc-dependent metalloprotease n=1 Tax=Ignavibacterium album TaxID=591197 RepID=UPI0026E95A96|nr:zinc-dependent metalloprotease family protein [Ignavibacterium album]
MIRRILLILIFSALSGFAQSLWSDLLESGISYSGERVIIPVSYRVLKLNTNLLKELLKTAPIEFSSLTIKGDAFIVLPMPDGTFQKFRFWESPTMEPELQNKFPEIRTYTGQGIDDPYATLKMDFTPQGFHAMILSPNGRVFIDPYAKGEINYYLSYYSKNFLKKDVSFDCEVLNHDEYIEPVANYYESLLTPTGPQLRTYRLANAATGEYTQYHGGTVASGLAAVTTSVNRVNGVFEREAAIRMVLVANNNLIIYTNPSTDPYTNNNGSAMLSQNISNLNAVIGSANYDIGHVFSTGGGGIAYLGCVCTSNKAGGVTGSPNPIGDPFDIDYVAHEMGHQFGANHTFNGNTGSCSGNRNASTAYEPGSGSTIMAYAGICAPQNLQSNSDAYFHTISFDEIVAYTTIGSGNSCAQITSTGNNAPNISVPTGGFYIPKSTPFALTGSATDPNGDALTYCWEEFDLGPAGDPNSPTGDAPIIRSFNPDTSRIRYVPKLSDLINNTSTYGVLLPSYSRNLKFRLTVRDNRAGGGGVDRVQVSFTVDGNSGPFVVTSPNTSVSWAGNSEQTVTWNVANTNLSPVNCSAVRILLSTNGGWTFNDTILSSTPNDGSEIITVPNIATNQARLKIEAVNNIFFDISDQNFTINYTQPTTFQLSVPIENGWNLVSIPGLHPVNQNPETWWQYKDPTAVVYSFNNGYVQVSSLEPGKGYWMKHSGNRIYNTGEEWPATGILLVPHNPIPINSGWNIVGGFENSAPVLGITTNPPGIIQTSFYSYNSVGGYQTVNSLTPGYGYWVKFSASGNMILPSLTENIDYKTANIVKPEWIKILITDSENRTSTLYLTNDESNLDFFELPPLPFTDMFDIRFSSNRFVEKCLDKQVILLQGVRYPLNIVVEDQNFSIMDENGFYLKNGKDKNSFILDNPEVKKIIMKKHNIPDEFVLEQNFPNPFNPTTKIRFTIPNVGSELAQTVLKVYDILGNEVSTLVNKELSSGFYEYEFDASSLPSGIYFYKLTAGKFNSLKKMILMK